MQKHNYYIYDSPIGKITIASDGNCITHLYLNDGKNFDGQFGKTELLDTAAKQVNEYLGGSRTVFEVPVNPKGTDFQKQVWAALAAIPFGETRSYKQISEAVGNPKAVRAVGMANNRNPVSIIIPCHRVIGSDGKLVGYASGLEIKEKLLKLEKGTKLCS